MKTGKLINRLFGQFKNKSQQPETIIKDAGPKIEAGDWVRVRSLEEIKGTLNSWGQLKGCMFMPNEMAMYCGTVHRVFRRMERFVDERDYHVKKVNGIILLENVHCQGTTDYGRCDRACFFFWREEWLEKIDPENVSSDQLVIN